MAITTASRPIAIASSSLLPITVRGTWPCSEYMTIFSTWPCLEHIISITWGVQLGSLALLFLASSSCIVAFALWSLHYGLCIVALALWPLHCGPCIIVSSTFFSQARWLCLETRGVPCILTVLLHVLLHCPLALSSCTVLLHRPLALGIFF
jgi:hypothetical protein